MLNTRNVVALVVIVGILSVLAAVIAVSLPASGSGLGIDTYGTRALGFRGLLETLEALGISVERSTAPPNRLGDRDVTLVLLEPLPELVAVEPAYLQTLAGWAHHGGCVVVAPSSRPLPRLNHVNRKMFSKGLLPELGLDGVRVDRTGPPGQGAPDSRDDDDFDVRKEVDSVLRPILGPAPKQKIQIVHATAEGDLAARFPQGLDLALPADAVHVLSDDRPAAGRIRAVVEAKGKSRTLAATYHVGEGTVTVISEPRMIGNEFVAQADNPVLACHLLADWKKPIVFDEFYHGLTVRGNPLWLLSRYPYSSLAATVLGAMLIVGWRAGRFLGPPLAVRERPRRTLSEYIDAMSLLLSRSRKPAFYILGEIRRGLLWRIRSEFGLPTGSSDLETLERAVTRRDPELGKKLHDAVTAIDRTASSGRNRPQDLEPIFKKVSLCVRRRNFQRRT